jgi:hypothetical protein
MRLKLKNDSSAAMPCAGPYGGLNAECQIDKDPCKAKLGQSRKSDTHVTPCYVAPLKMASGS